jgi:hypothetical protein
MNDFTVVYANQRAAAALLLVASICSAGVAVAASTQPTEHAQSAATATVKPDPPIVPAGDARDEKRIKEMHDNLQILPLQEPLWLTVANTMRTNDGRLEELATKRHDQASTMTAVEDLASYAEMTYAHYESVKAFHSAFVPLYESMTVLQKANADRVFRSTGKKGHKKAP